VQETLEYQSLEAITQALVTALQDKPYFCLWLEGDIGAGKTTLSQRVLHGLGVPQHIHITSPTFTYINTYSVGPKVYAHLDLYRMEASSSLDILLTEPYDGLIVEWPRQVLDSQSIHPTHHLVITKSCDHSQRVYRLTGA
jgi:tRNA threonylcarbamoyladenosine biosynthesis protein TsaE